MVISTSIPCPFECVDPDTFVTGKLSHVTVFFDYVGTSSLFVLPFTPATGMVTSVI